MYHKAIVSVTLVAIDNKSVLINKVIVSIILVAIDKKSVLKNNFSLGVKKGVKSY